MKEEERKNVAIINSALTPGECVPAPASGDTSGGLALSPVNMESDRLPLAPPPSLPG